MQGLHHAACVLSSGWAALGSHHLERMRMIETTLNTTTCKPALANAIHWIIQASHEIKRRLDIASCEPAVFLYPGSILPEQNVCVTPEAHGPAGSTIASHRRCILVRIDAVKVLELAASLKYLHCSNPCQMQRLCEAIVEQTRFGT